MANDTSDLIYSPAKRRGIGVLIMLAGASGSGKTKSALRLATGLANGGTIGFCDTEHGRATYYADDFDFQHLELKEPFTPARFEAAAVISQRANHAVWICDSFSHEHVGPGGVLDMQEAQLQKLTRGDFEKRDALKYTAWIQPKGEHKHLVQRLWQLNQHIILCVHAEKKLDLIKNDKGKTVPNPDAGLSPVCSPDIPYAMTVSFMMDAKRPGVPSWLKPFDKILPLVNTNAVLDEETGRRIGAWARGGESSKTKTQVQVSNPAVEETRSAEGASPEQPAAPPPANEQPPADRPARSELPLGDDQDDAKIVAGVDALIARFQAVRVRADHTAIVDVKADRDRISWLKKHKPDQHARLRVAMEASWARTDPKKEAA